MTHETKISTYDCEGRYTIELQCDTKVSPWKLNPEPENQDVLPSVSRPVAIHIYNGKTRQSIVAQLVFTYVDGHRLCMPGRRLSLEGCRGATFEKILNVTLREAFFAAANAMSFALLPYAREALYNRSEF